MNNATVEEQIQSFNDVQCIVANEERFKVKLGAGLKGYTSLKTVDLFNQISSIGGAAKTGAGLASSSTVASTFFPTLFSNLGFASAATPVGWVIAAAVASGGVYYGASRLFKSYYGSRVDEVPKFLNTALDVLAASTLDLLGSLSLRVALIDGEIDPAELSSMTNYFVEEWGYDRNYVSHTLDILMQNADKTRLNEMTRSLAEFARANPDCDFVTIQSEIRKLLVEIAEADGEIDEREEMAIERIENALDAQNSFLNSISETLSTVTHAAASTTSATSKSVSDMVSNAFSSVSQKVNKK